MSEFFAQARNGADRRASVHANGLELAYEQFGRDGDPAVLLIMGLGMQLTGWPDAFCRGLADTGLRVIRFDNRDIGLSAKLDGKNDYDSPRVAFCKAVLGKTVKPPYTLDDMAADAVGVMDALGIDAAHVVGASMGGMIAQLMAARYPERALTLTSIMSSTGDPKLPRAKLGILLRLTRAPRSGEPAAVAAHMARTMRIIGSRDPAYQRSHAQWATEILPSVQRGYYPAGARRQTLAVMAAPSRAECLGAVQVPSLVIHGQADPLLPVAHGRATAQALRAARYEEVPGMGHDLPQPLLARFVDLISQLSATATA